jgi:multiple antibiotic resistance protein
MGPSAMSLATPLIAGPGAIKATLLLESRAGGNSLWLLALVLIIAAVALASAPSLLLAGVLSRVLGRPGNIVPALLGILLAAFTTQFAADGITSAFHRAD